MSCKRIPLPALLMSDPYVLSKAMLDTGNAGRAVFWCLETKMIWVILLVYLHIHFASTYIPADSHGHTHTRTCTLTHMFTVGSV